MVQEGEQFFGSSDEGRAPGGMLAGQRCGGLVNSIDTYL